MFYYPYSDALTFGIFLTWRDCFSQGHPISWANKNLPLNILFKYKPAYPEPKFLCLFNWASTLWIITCLVPVILEPGYQTAGHNLHTPKSTKITHSSLYVVCPHLINVLPSLSLSSLPSLLVFPFLFSLFLFVYRPLLFLFLCLLLLSLPSHSLFPSLSPPSVFPTCLSGAPGAN